MGGFFSRPKPPAPPPPPPEYKGPPGVPGAPFVPCAGDTGGVFPVPTTLAAWA